MKKKIIKFLSSLIIVPIAKKYLAKDRSTTINGIKLIVQKNVFHPAFYFSTKYLLSWLKKQNLNNINFLELGAGSGLLSIYAAKQNAYVTALDISQNACDNVAENARLNNVNINVVNSNLFANIKQKQFNLVIINPPYYPKKPITEADYAWYCGANFEYFENLFASIHQYILKGKAIMVLSDDCAIDTIKAIALKSNLSVIQIDTKQNWMERNFLFEITNKII